jgi:hypothetical protein
MAKKAERKTSARRRKGAKRSPKRKAGSRQSRKWSHRVTKESDALDLERSVFKHDSPKKIAASLKRSAERSRRRKSSPYRSAMSMLTFYINRAGRNLPARRKRILAQAKEELREQFGRA